MFKKALITAAAAVVFSGATQAADRDGLSFSAGIGYLDGRLSGVGLDHFVGVVSSVYPVAPYFSLDGRIGVGLNSKNVISADLQLESFASIIGRIGPTFGDARPYIAAGYSRLSASVSSGLYSVSDSETGASFGFGVTGYNNVSRFGTTIEYMNYYDSSSASASVLSVSLTRHF